jgi:hypothetical protein
MAPTLTPIRTAARTVTCGTRVARGGSTYRIGTTTTTATRMGW